MSAPGSPQLENSGSFHKRPSADPSQVAPQRPNEGTQSVLSPSTGHHLNEGRSKSPYRTNPATNIPSDESSHSSDDDSDELEEGPDPEREVSVSGSESETELGSNDIVYVLEVIQQPQRARACGFGDKDRRPLSPPPIIELRVLDKLGNVISPNRVIDYHRFILMVDLWNGDRTQQRSIVMHPGARQDQYALFTHTAARPTSSHRNEAGQPNLNRLPFRAGWPPPPHTWQMGDWSTTASRNPHYEVISRHPHGGPVPHFSAPAGPHPGRLPSNVEPVSRAVSTSHIESRTAMAIPGAPQGDPYDGRYYPSSMPRPNFSQGEATRSSSSSWPGLGHDSQWAREPTPPVTELGVDRQYPFAFRPATSTSAESSGWRKEVFHSTTGREGRPHTQGSYANWEGREKSSPRPWASWSESEAERPPSHSGPPFSQTLAASPSSQSMGSMGLPLTTSPRPSTSVGMFSETYPERAPSTSHYSRVLVGSMGASCQRLKGLDGMPGLFFFAHDLGIRTEGTFSLRFTLVDITSLMPATVIKDQSAPILARVFSDPFTVYSAKRFPGVLPTTDLTQCFADQSVRLPTRQKRIQGATGNVKRRKS